MYPVKTQIYGPIVREKAGELSATFDLHDPIKQYMLPTWVALPLNAKENAALSPVDVMKREVGRVQTAWGANVCLWDSRFLKFDDEPDVDAERLKHVLDQFVVFGCKVIPVVSLRESYVRLSAAAAHSKESNSGLAVRIEFDDIDNPELLESVLRSTSHLSSEVILLIDMTDADMNEHDDFAKFLISAMDKISSRGNWARIIVAASSYPLKNPATDNSEALPDRQEWKVWTWALQLNPALSASVVFGDFGADNAHFNFEGGGIPIPHLRYALKSNWRVVRGSKAPSAMRGVTRKIANSTSFMGRHFSAGDEFIADCANGLGTNGDATKWRSVNMNHHFTLVLTELATLYGLTLPARETRPHQVPLFQMDPAE
jgi:hypothetical protein